MRRRDSQELRRETEELLRREVSGLGISDILALCYSFQNRTPRLRLYLDVLRRLGGERAQFASCLVCFDLARQGDATSQHEFVFLADTIRRLAEKTELVENLISEDPYLLFVWELCQAQLAEMDPRFEAETTAPLVEKVAELDLLSDEDFQDFGIWVDDAELLNRFDEAVETFLGSVVGVPVFDPEAGFRMRHRRDVDRVEHFLRELDSLRDYVPAARGMRALTLLFYGTHLRSKSFFGQINQRKQALLREGIREFVTSGPETWEVAGMLSPMHAEPRAWQKIGDVLADYVRWMGCNPELALKMGPDGYDAVERLIFRDSNRGRGS